MKFSFLRQKICLCSLFLSTCHFLTADLSPPVASYWGGYIIDAKTQEVLFSHNDSKFFIPCSLTKLFTSYLALERLGEDFQFETQVAISGDIEPGGRLQGDVILIGGGDPSLTEQDLKKLALYVHYLGIRTIGGNVVADDTLFHGCQLPPHVEWEDLSCHYAAEVSSLTVNNNSVLVTLIPDFQREGLTEAHVYQAVPYCKLINHVKCKPLQHLSKVNFFRDFKSNVIELDGYIGKNPWSYSIPVHNPTEYARLIFLKYLHELGIQEEAQSAEVFNRSYEVIGIHKSPPLSEILKELNKNSNNLYGNLLIKMVGVRTNPNLLPDDAGFEAMAEDLSEMGMRIGSYILYDGSGLSRHNLLTSRQVVHLLNWVRKKPYFDTFFESLPEAGLEGTTADLYLEKREGIKIFAKSGGMTGLAGLGGYAKAPSGKEVIFCFFVNHEIGSLAKTAKDLEIALLSILEDL